MVSETIVNNICSLLFENHVLMMESYESYIHHNIHKLTWTYPDGKTHNQIDLILIDRRLHSSILDVRLFRTANCDTDHYLVAVKVRKRLAVSKQTITEIIWRGSVSRN
jgi:hypothetical protein